MRPASAAISFAVALAGCGGGATSPMGTLSCDATEPEHSGEATYYTFANGDGNCMFGPSSESPLMIGAMNHTDYAASAVCGACIELTGPNGAISIRIVDQCPECPVGNIDLSPDAFALIAPLEQGRVPITWRYASCDVSGSIVYHFKDGSSQWWTAVQIRNHRNRVARVAYLAGDGTYKEVDRVDYNYFVEAGGMGPGPYTFRVTDVYGNVVEDQGIQHVENGDVPGQSQFPPCGG